MSGFMVAVVESRHVGRDVLNEYGLHIELATDSYAVLSRRDTDASTFEAVRKHIQDAGIVAACYLLSPCQYERLDAFALLPQPAPRRAFPDRAVIKFD